MADHKVSNGALQFGLDSNGDPVPLSSATAADGVTDAGLVVAELSTLIAGEDQTKDVLVVEQGRYGFLLKTTTALETIGSAPGDYLHSIVIGLQDTAGTITLQDAGNTILVLPIGTVAGTVIQLGITAVASIKCSKTVASDRVTLIGRFT